MAQGFLEIRVVAEVTNRPIEGATVTIVGVDNQFQQTMTTDKNGNCPPLALETVDKNLSLEAIPNKKPFFSYLVSVKKEGYEALTDLEVSVFDGITAQMPITMKPKGGVSPAAVLNEEEIRPAQTIVETPVIPTPIIPINISVKLGTPTSNAPVVSVPYSDYIKNVASSEIFPTWPEEALKANILAIQSIALNRLYTEWYWQRGYNFSITSSTAYDQKYTPDKAIYDNISELVNDSYPQYIRKIGNIEPLFATFCDGIKVQCNGLHQWGTVDLAKQGMNALEILKHYYGNNIEIAESAIIQDVAESYPGTPLHLGSTGPSVFRMQLYLIRIAVNYPQIPSVYPINGIFDRNMEAAVREFQRVFNLPVTGVIDRDTWYKIAYFYNGVKRTAELQSEGIISPRDYAKFAGTLKPGDNSVRVLVLQYIIDTINKYDPDIPPVKIDMDYGPNTRRAVTAFQKKYNLPQTGIVDEATWNMFVRIGNDHIYSFPPTLELYPYPGEPLAKFDRSIDVLRLQRYLNAIGKQYRSIESTPADGIFGPNTEGQVLAFQREFGLEPTGIVDKDTWDAILKIYAAVLPVVLYPGTPLRYNDTSYYVAVMQDYLNTIAPEHPTIEPSVVDEWYGPLTRSAVLEFQRLYGLELDGIVGKETWNKLVEEYMRITKLSEPRLG